MFDALTSRVRKALSTKADSASLGGQRPHVVIVGAGFAGLHAAKALAGEAVRVTLLDRNNYHKFQPLLYQVATAGLEPDAVAHSVRDIFRPASNVDFKLATVSNIDPECRQVATRSGLKLNYDYLILAAGAVTSYFGVEGAREHSFPLKNLSDAIALRNHILRQFERVDRQRPDGSALEGDETARDGSHPECASSLPTGALRFVVVGGGPTGVETAGALTELFRILQRDYKRFDTTAAEVILIEMDDQLLPAYQRDQGEYTREVLKQRGVQVLTGTTVERIEKHTVHLEGGRRIATDTLIWGAGVAAHPVAESLAGAERVAGGRVKVERDLRVEGHEHLFAVGDVSAGEDEEGQLYAQLAPVAIQQGQHAAQQILRLEKGHRTESFSYRDLGKMATIGRNAAVAELPGGIRLEGFIAWLAWVFIHIAKLIGFRNRVNVFIDWIYNYFTYDRSARLILDVVPIFEGIPREVEEVDAELQQTMRAMEPSTSNAGSDAN